MPAKVASINDYIASLSPSGAQVARQLCSLIEDVVPAASLSIRYNMPAFQLHGQSFLYFAVWKKHVSLYPIYRGDKQFEHLVGPFRAHKDTVQFPLSVALPEELIREIVRLQAITDGITAPPEAHILPN